MTVAELIDLLRTQDPLVEVKVVLPQELISAANGATLEVTNAVRCLPHNGRRQVHIVTTE
jgi:hypothetical protein